MAAREIDILIDYIVDSDPLHEVNQQMNNIVTNADAVSVASTRMADDYVRNIDRMHSAQRNFTAGMATGAAVTGAMQGPSQQGSVTNMRPPGRDYMSERYGRWRHEQRLLTEESRAMQQEMRYGWMQQGPAYAQALNNMVRMRYEFFQLARVGQDYAGSTRQFVNNLHDLGNQMRNVRNEMINSNNQIRQSMYTTAATMATMTTQASRITDNYIRMRNPLYLATLGNLRMADSLNRIANNANPAMLALRMLGPSASNVQLQNMIMMINQGLIRMAYAAIGAAVASYFLYTQLHKAAMANEEYNSAFTTMVETVRTALQPMVDAFIAMMVPLYKFITYIAELVIAFNEAHPVLAKFIQGALMLIPALTLILSPLAAGIGLWAGYAAALGALWVWIGPAITGMAAMSATVWIVAAAIVALTMYISHLWKTNEGFRSGVINAWDSIKTGIGTAIDFIIEKGSQFMSVIKDAINGDTKAIEQIFAQLFPTILGLIVGGIPGLIISFSRFLPGIVENIEGGSGSIVSAIEGIFTKIISFITTQLPGLLQKGVEIIKMLAEGIIQALPILATAFISAIQSLLPVIATLLPVLLEAGVNILQSIIEGILQTIPALVPVILEVINSLIMAITELLPTLIETGMQILMSLIDGIVQMLPMIITTALTLITTLVTGLVQLLPTIIQTGVQVLTALINGIIQILPQLITTALTLITTLATAIINNLPAILAAGGQILKALINGIIQLIGELLNTGRKLINDLADTFRELDFTTIGKNIIQGLINGIGSMIDGAVSAAKKVASAVSDTITGFFDMHSPSVLMKQDGAFITQGLAIGIEKEIPMAVTAADRLSQATYGSVQPASVGDGSSTTNNNGGNKNIFAPNIQVSGGGSGVREEINNAMDEAFATYAEQFGF